MGHFSDEDDDYDSDSTIIDANDNLLYDMFDWENEPSQLSDDSDPAVRQPEIPNPKDVSEKCVNISIHSDSAFDNIAPESSPADSIHSIQSMELPKVHEGSRTPTVKYAHTCRESESKLEKIEQSICDLLVSFKAKSMEGTNTFSPEETPERLSLLKCLEKKINQLSDLVNKKFSDINKKINQMSDMYDKKHVHTTDASTQTVNVSNVRTTLTEPVGPPKNTTEVCMNIFTDAQTSKTSTLLDTPFSDDKTTPLCPNIVSEPHTLTLHQDENTDTSNISLDNWDIFLPTAEEQNYNQSKTGSKTQDASISVTPSDLHSKDDENYATRTAKNNEIPSLLITGDSNVRYVYPNRLIKGKKVKRVELWNKNLYGATKYISNMKNPPPFLHIQCGGNDVDYKSIYTVTMITPYDIVALQETHTGIKKWRFVIHIPWRVRFHYQTQQ